MILISFTFTCTHILSSSSNKHGKYSFNLFKMMVWHGAGQPFYSACLIIIMRSNYNYLRSSPSSRLNSSTSAQKFYRAASDRMNNYHGLASGHGNDCLACLHEHSKRSGFGQEQLSSRISAEKGRVQQQQYYSSSQQQEFENLRKAKRFLEDLLHKTRKDYTAAVQQYESQLAALTQQAQANRKTIQRLQAENSVHQLNLQYPATSRVNTYQQKEEPSADRIKEQKKRQEILQKMQQLQSQNDFMRQTSIEDKKNLIELNSLQQRVKQYEIYFQQYQSMKLLIHKMEMDREDTLRSHSKAITDMSKKHSLQLAAYAKKLQQLKAQNIQKTQAITLKQQQIQKTRTASHSQSQSQFTHLQQLLQDKDEQIEKLESRITCIESELTFLKNRYGYLLKLTRSGITSNAPQSSQDLDDYCIERVGRYNVSDGKESLIGFNLSPIKRRL